MRGVGAVYGAISLVNAIATGRGATLGISLYARATVDISPGSGIVVGPGASKKLVCRTIEEVVPRRELGRNRITVSVESDIPAGYGLKSSSAISSAVSLACARLFRPRYTDRQVLLAGVRASIKSGVSITGAYDDACACYYGGFNVTDNHTNRRVSYGRAPRGLDAVIFIPHKRGRGKPKVLRETPGVFEKAWELARDGMYWEAMSINGYAAASTLNSDPALVAELVSAGALGASVSGNGPAVAAIAKRRDVPRIREVFGRMDGSTMVSAVNNRGARWTV